MKFTTNVEGHFYGSYREKTFYKEGKLVQSMIQQIQSDGPPQAMLSHDEHFCTHDVFLCLLPEKNHLAIYQKLVVLIYSAATIIVTSLKISKLVSTFNTFTKML